MTSLEIGPGTNSLIVKELKQRGSTGKHSLFIEPDITSAAVIELQLPSAKVIPSKIENVVASLPPVYFDFIYANFSLHWSDNLHDVLQGLARTLKPKGKMGVTITDQARSFWAQINSEFKETFPGCDLFNATEIKSLPSESWLRAFSDSGFKLDEDIIFSGTAAKAEDTNSALEGFKKSCGDKYLKLNNDTSEEAAEAWVLKKLQDFQDSEGRVLIPASGRSFIVSKN